MDSIITTPIDITCDVSTIHHHNGDLATLHAHDTMNYQKRDLFAIGSALTCIQIGGTIQLDKKLKLKNNKNITNSTIDNYKQ